MTKNKDAALMPVEHISRSILVLRRQRVCWIAIWRRLMA